MENHSLFRRSVRPLRNWSWPAAPKIWWRVGFVRSHDVATAVSHRASTERGDYSSCGLTAPPKDSEQKITKRTKFLSDKPCNLRFLRFLLLKISVIRSR